MRLLEVLARFEQAHSDLEPREVYMEAEKKPRKIRLISGPPALVDAQVNELLDQYALTSINFATTNEGVIVTCYLVLASEIRMMQIASGVAQGNQRQ